MHRCVWNIQLRKVLANYLLIFGGFVIITGVGIFEANASQFGLDQLLEALTPKLISSTGTNWSQNVEGLLLYYVCYAYFTFA